MTLTYENLCCTTRRPTEHPSAGFQRIEGNVKYNYINDVIGVSVHLLVESTNCARFQT